MPGEVVTGEEPVRINEGRRTAESDARIDATLAPHLPEGATVDRERVSPALFDGDVGAGPHSHTHGADAARGHDRRGPHGGDGS